MMRGTFPDTNRLSLVTQRRFHTAWDEMRGCRVQIVPTVARELTTNVTVDFPQASEPVLAEEALKEMPGSRKRLRLESDLWWTRQWVDSQGNYHLHRLTEQQDAKVGRLIDAMDPADFYINKEEMRQHRDTWIVCETLAVGGTLQITANLTSMDHDRINDWVASHRQQFALASDKVIYDPDPTLARMAKTRPVTARHLLRTTLGAWWPDDGNASDDEAIAAAEAAVEPLAEARLPQTAAEIRKLLASSPELEILVEEVRRNLPVKLRAAERAHPTWPGRRERKDRSVVVPGG